MDSFKLFQTFFKIRFLTLYTILSLSSFISINAEVCQSIAIKNVGNIAEYANCTIVEGDLSVSVISSRNNPFKINDFRDYSFKNLREITGYLQIYHVQGLPTLSYLFPNLSVIKGQHVAANYALIIYQSQDLLNIGLHNLTYVGGAVLIGDNRKLCYVNTVDWKSIIHPDHFSSSYFKNNQDSLSCVDACSNVCPVINSRNRCWSVQECESANTCSSCQKIANLNMCHHNKKGESSCIGGCSGPRNTDCVACAKNWIGNQCVEKCPGDMLQLESGRCVKREECFEMQVSVFDCIYHGLPSNLRYKEYEGNCILRCPEGYEENKNTCVRCKNSRCRKVCRNTRVGNNIEGLLNLKDCTEIDGSLELEISSAYVAKELKALKNIQRISGYLKISHSRSIVSLAFFESLTHIGGERLTRTNYSVSIYDNRNLTKLWLEKQNITLEKGKMFVHANPKLCLNEIYRQAKQFGIPWDSPSDISPITNGDRADCNLQKLKIDISETNEIAKKARWLKIVWDGYNGTDRREVLSYTIAYREVKENEKEEDISYYDEIDRSDKNWFYEEVDYDPQDKSRPSLYLSRNRYEPFTKYVFYVIAKTINTRDNAFDRQGAQGGPLFYTTQNYIPNRPADVRISSPTSDSLKVKWSPPEKPNGIIVLYKVRYLRYIDNETDHEKRDYCVQPLEVKSDWFDETDDESSENPAFKYLNRTVINGTDCCSCSAILNKDLLEIKKKPKDETERKSIINFENWIQGQSIVEWRLDRKCKNRQKREILEAIENNADQLQVEPDARLDELDESNSTLVNYEYQNDTEFEEMEALPPDNEILPAEKELWKEVIVRNDTQFLLSGLVHFSEYWVQVIACQANDLCSTVRGASKRVRPLATGDNIVNETVRVQAHESNRSSVLIAWREPKNPNSVIVKFIIEYYPISDTQTHIPLTVCVTLKKFRNESAVKGGYEITNLGPGNYSFRVLASSLAGDGAWTEPVYFLVKGSHVAVLSVELIIVVVVCVCMILMIIIAFTVCVYRREKKQYPSGMTVTLNPYYPWEEGPTQYVVDDWEVERDKIRTSIEIGEGGFGKVWQGEAVDLRPGMGVVPCAIKTVTENATPYQRFEFLHEASHMKRFKCHHIVELLGVVSIGQPTLVVMELMPNGDLRTYLRTRRPDERNPNKEPPPGVERLIQMSGEICDGMVYLSEHKFVHRDLAARNCLVNSDLTVKLGDFGMTRDIYQNDYYRKGGRGMLPVRWMGPESLLDGVYTSASDVWSFGVVLWEMVTLGEQPYQGMGNEEVLKFIKGGKTMEREIPTDCPEILRRIIQSCWKYRPDERVKFPQILCEIMDQMSESFKEKSYYCTTYLPKIEAEKLTGVRLGPDGQPIDPNSVDEEGQIKFLNCYEDLGPAAEDSFISPTDSHNGTVVELTSEHPYASDDSTSISRKRRPADSNGLEMLPLISSNVMDNNVSRENSQSARRAAPKRKYDAEHQWNDDKAYFANYTDMSANDDEHYADMHNDAHGTPYTDMTLVGGNSMPSPDALISLVSPTKEEHSPNKTFLTNVQTRDSPSKLSLSSVPSLPSTSSSHASGGPHSRDNPADLNNGGRRLCAMANNNAYGDMFNSSSASSSNNSNNTARFDRSFKYNNCGNSDFDAGSLVYPKFTTSSLSNLSSGECGGVNGIGGNSGTNHRPLRANRSFHDTCLVNDEDLQANRQDSSVESVHKSRSKSGADRVVPGKQGDNKGALGTEC